MEITSSEKYLVTGISFCKKKSLQFETSSKEKALDKFDKFSQNEAIEFVYMRDLKKSADKSLVKISVKGEHDE